MLLAIDTATNFAGLALWDDGQLWAEEAWYSNLTHSVELMPRIQRMLTSHRLTVEALSGIGVSLGPGSFTGLRTGLAAAKGLALPYRLPLIGIATLDAVAYPFQRISEPVWAVIQAGRSRIGVACYRQVDDMWAQVVAPALTTFEGLCQMAKPPALFAGEIDKENAGLLQQRLGPEVVIPSPALRFRRAGCLAELAVTRLANNDVDDAATLSPIYLSLHTSVSPSASSGQALRQRGDTDVQIAEGRPTTDGETTG
jgi:tRNA threonylcarbamoyladenosine biosynthesis protein TsaB